jgi:hypothetical protein
MGLVRLSMSAVAYVKFSDIGKAVSIHLFARKYRGLIRQSSMFGNACCMSGSLISRGKDGAGK